MLACRLKIIDDRTWTIDEGLVVILTIKLNGVSLSSSNLKNMVIKSLMIQPQLVLLFQIRTKEMDCLKLVAFNRGFYF